MKKKIKKIEEKFEKLERRVWKLIFHFHYPKILILMILIVWAYFIFKNPDVQNFVHSLKSLEYLGVLIAGMLFTFGFTTPFSVGFFVVLNPANPLLVALIGGLGAVIGDLFIFSVIRFSFIDEFKRLKKTRIIKGIRDEMKWHLSHRVRIYILYTLAGIIIASPLPDEAGVMMLAGLTKIKLRTLIPISFVFNSLGIFLMCLI